MNAFDGINIPTQKSKPKAKKACSYSPIVAVPSTGADSAPTNRCVGGGILSRVYDKSWQKAYVHIFHDGKSSAYQVLILSYGVLSTYVLLDKDYQRLMQDVDKALAFGQDLPIGHYIRFCKKHCVYKRTCYLK